MAGKRVKPPSKGVFSKLNTLIFGKTQKASKAAGAAAADSLMGTFTRPKTATGAKRIRNK